MVMGKASRKKKKKSRRKPALNDTAVGPWGFDYGQSIRVAAIGSIDFNQRLREADIIGVAYGMNYSVDLGSPVPALTLVGRNERPLRQAFEEFAHWAESSDADAADVTLVFLKNCGYRLIICPEPKALIKRTLKYDAVADPISFQVSWIKSIDTVSEPLRQLRTHLERGIRPYILSAATYLGIEKPGVAPAPELVRAVRDIKQLLKFKIRFVDEGAEADKEWQRMALLDSDTKTKRKKRASPAHLPPPESLFTIRINRLKTIFPVTLWRGKNNDAFRDACVAAEQLGLRQWQVQQALCNSVVSHEIGTGLPHFKGIRQSEWPDTLVTKLRQRYEVADGRTELGVPVTPEEIVRQAILDAGTLLRGCGLQPVPSNLEAIQAELHRRHLLEGQSEL